MKTQYKKNKSLSVIHPIEGQLKWIHKWLLRIFLFFAFKLHDYRDRLISYLEALKDILASETVHNKEMFEIYVNQAKGEATKKQVKAANAQFKELIKGLGVGIFLFLPLSFITLPVLVRLSRKLGVEILPKSVKGLFD